VYVLSEDYRFLIKKVKYDDSVVYEREIKVSDQQDILFPDTETETASSLSNTGSKNSISGKTEIEKNTKKTGAVALSL
jgi:hypothetical protein